MLLSAPSLGGSASLHGARGFHQLRQGADGRPSGTRARQRRSDLARTAAEILVADLNRPARGRHGRGHALGLRWDCASCFYTIGRCAPYRFGRRVLGAAGSAHGGTGTRADKTAEVDTEHMFGFTEGSDVGAAGEKELETDSTGRFGKLRRLPQ